MRRLVTLTALAMLLSGVLIGSAPASAQPIGCAINPGKVVDATSHANRSIDVRWPGMTCTTPGKLTITAHLRWRVGTVWYSTRAAFYVHSTLSTGTSIAGTAMTTSCTHRDLTEVLIEYINGANGSSKGVLTSAAVCS